MLTPEELEAFQPDKIRLASWNAPLRQGIEALCEALSGKTSMICRDNHTFKGIYTGEREVIRSAWTYYVSRSVMEPTDTVDESSLHAKLCTRCVLHRFDSTTKLPPLIQFARHLSIALRKEDVSAWTFGYNTKPTELFTVTHRAR